MYYYLGGGLYRYYVGAFHMGGGLKDLRDDTVLLMSNVNKIKLTSGNSQIYYKIFLRSEQLWPEGKFFIENNKWLKVMANTHLIKNYKWLKGVLRYG